MSHISSAYRLLTTCVYVHVRKGARGSRLNHDAKLVIKFLASARNASYCELVAICLHMLTYICVGLRKIKVSDGFRKSQMVSEGVGFQVSGLKFQEEKNKTLKTKTTFLTTIAIAMA